MVHIEIKTENSKTKLDPFLIWVSQKTDPETRIWVHIA